MGSYYAGVINSDYDSELRHHGILGQKWGVRRFQNEDGTLTEAGKKRYGYKSVSESERARFVKSDLGYKDDTETPNYRLRRLSHNKYMAAGIVVDNYLAKNGKLPDSYEIDNVVSEMDDEVFDLSDRFEKADDFRDRMIQTRYNIDDGVDGYRFDEKNVPKNWHNHFMDVAERVRDKIGETEMWNKRNDLEKEYKTTLNPIKKRKIHQQYLDAKGRYDRLAYLGDELFVEEIQKEIEKLPKNQQNQAMYLIAETFYS